MQPVNNFFQSGIITIDRVLNYIPYYSIYNNGVCLIAKGILHGMQSKCPSAYAKIQMKIDAIKTD